MTGRRQASSGLASAKGMDSLAGMREVNLKSLDLNLLVTLEALLEERSVTRAGRRVGRSQPAISRSLKLLRSTFNDPLLVPAGRALVPTERARELEAKLGPILSELRALFAPPSFDLAEAEGAFAVDAPEASLLLLLVPLIERAAVDAPKLEFRLSNNPAERFSGLGEGAIDLAIDVSFEPPISVYKQTIVEQDLVCIVRRGHPLRTATMKRRDYEQLPHVWVDTATSAALRNHIDSSGIRCRWAVKTSSFLTGASIVARTDYLMSLPRVVAYQASQYFPIEMRELPFELGTLPLAQFWHERSHRDPAHIWLRNAIWEQARELTEQGMALRVG